MARGDHNDPIHVRFTFGGDPNKFPTDLIWAWGICLAGFALFLLWVS